MYHFGKIIARQMLSAGGRIKFMHLILDFTHTYPEQWIEENNDFTYIDCSDISGTDMYCTEEAEGEIYRRVSGYPQGGIHFTDSGNYHYVTAVFVKKIQKPYNLIFFDNHNDMQPTMIPELLSCGAWAKRLIESDDNLRHIFLIGPETGTINDIGNDMKNRERLVCISIEEIESCGDELPDLIKLINKKLTAADMSLPLYISVDKDVLSEEYARTNWNQGRMSLNTLKLLLGSILDVSRANKGYVSGVDICGELPQKDASFTESSHAGIINSKTNRELIEFIKPLI
jgi:arginase family enzyme